MASTLVSLVRERAASTPDAIAYGFAVDGERDVRTLTCAELDRSARRVASLVGERLAPGARAVLVLEPGLDFLAAFYGCLYAGVVAVPVYPPAFRGHEDGVANVARVAADCGPEALLVSAGSEGLVSLPSVPALRVDGGAGDPGAWRDRGVVGSEAVAFLQYTSGSTSRPKAVVLRHADLLANLAAVHAFLRARPGGACVSWLPMYHDMGLIGIVMYAVYAGVPAYLMSPLHFLQRPARWLELISRVGGTVTGAPNFAYDLCARKVTEEERAGLDLSSLRIAFDGSEPVRAATIRRFEEAFAPCGLRPLTVMGCYGMAEATLIVTGDAPERGPRTGWFDRAALEHGWAVRVEAGEAGAVELASSGAALCGGEVRIVDPAASTPLEDGRVGEIWFRGPGVAADYWNRPSESAAAFGGRFAGEPDAGDHLRTGDLGFVVDGQLYVTDRLKDVLIVRGRNIAPHDVEHAAQSADARLRPGCGAAFAVAARDGEGIALVQETTASDPDDLRDLARRIREAVATALQLSLAELHLVAPRTVLKTTSGKLRRRATRDALASGAITPLHSEGGTPATPASTPPPDPSAAARTPPPDSSATAGAALSTPPPAGAERAGNQAAPPRPDDAPHPGPVPA